MKDQLQRLFQQAIDALVTDNTFNETIKANVQLERSKNSEHGDLACNLALMLAKKASMPPRALAEKIVQSLPDNALIEKIDIAGPGFMNIFLNKSAATAVITQILSEKEHFGRNHSGNGELTQVEFVSANPTGPLHIGHGRGAAVGDSLCRLLRANGFDAKAEFYYNDAGAQIETLMHSTHARLQGLTPESPNWPENAGYLGEYIQDVADSYKNKDTINAKDISVTAKGDPEDLEAIKHFAVAYLRHEQDLDLQAFDVEFDYFFLESSLYTDGKVEQAVDQLIANGKTYEKDNALWLKTTDYGDDKDRVMKKADGYFTYFVPDVAYHLDKWQRGFTRVINEQGADHHSTITRVRAGLQALDKGIPEGWPEYVLHQMVLVMKGGEEVKLSKRAGSYVTLRDLIDEVGRDATRFFLVSRRPDAQLTFDIDLAKSQSNENPVYYIQYAHARAASVLSKIESDKYASADLSLLTTTEEATLLKRLSQYPEVVRAAGEKLEPHQIANYCRELAGEFHSYYNADKIITENDDLSAARAQLVAAVKQVIINALDLLGVTAPDKM
ncbi:MAG: arginine--tRNA ligase [Cellvibrionales bacterium]|nr:arginine--tRNA ligase [Cellvibrionales bacterium]